MAWTLWNKRGVLFAHDERQHMTLVQIDSAEIQSLCDQISDTSKNLDKIIKQRDEFGTLLERVVGEYVHIVRTGINPSCSHTRLVTEIRKAITPEENDNDKQAEDKRSS